MRLLLALARFLTPTGLLESARFLLFALPRLPALARLRLESARLFLLLALTLLLNLPLLTPTSLVASTSFSAFVCLLRLEFTRFLLLAPPLLLELASILLLKL